MQKTSPLISLHYKFSPSANRVVQLNLKQEALKIFSIVSALASAKSTLFARHVAKNDANDPTHPKTGHYLSRYSKHRIPAAVNLHRSPCLHCGPPGFRACRSRALPFVERDTAEGRLVEARSFTELRCRRSGTKGRCRYPRTAKFFRETFGKKRRHKPWWRHRRQIQDKPGRPPSKQH